MIRQCLLAIATWYFVLSYDGGTLQVGPFTTQAGCEKYRDQAIAVLGSAAYTVPCFSTKQ